jgi:subtilase family serine protease
MKLNVLVCLCTLLAVPGLAENARAQFSPEASSARRLTEPIDESQIVPLKGNVRPIALSQADRGLAPISAPTGRIALLLRRSTAQQQALTEYLSEVENPSSSAFRKWLTPAQYGAQFGVDPGDVQAIESWLQSHGFRIEKVPASGNVIVFSGTIDQVQSTFHTSIHAFAVQGETRFANVTDVSVPAALAPLIAGVGPLNNFGARPGARVSATGTWDAASHAIEPDLTLFSGTTPLLFVDPADAATIYDTPNSTLNPNYTAGTSYTGTGATIGIVGVSNVDMQDISNYRTAFLGESAGATNLPTVILDGNDPGVVSGGAGVEALLDNEVAGGIAPGAKVDFYISAGSDLSDGLFNAIERAIDDNAVDILSISFGNCESVLGTSGNQLMLELSEQAAAAKASVQPQAATRSR